MAQHHDSIQANFLKGATKKEHFVESNLPEVAMIGRSNVGKSSLINTVLRSGSHARVSNTPGKTQEINFFTTDLNVMVVDLPGYGYAQVSKQQRQQFSSLINDYLFSRTQLRVVFVLIDARHDPQALDMAMLEQLEFGGVKFVVVLTKCDKLTPKQVVAREEQLRMLTGSCQHCIDVIVTSSKSGDGRASIIGVIKKFRNTVQVQQ